AHKLWQVAVGNQRNGELLMSWRGVRRGWLLLVFLFPAAAASHAAPFLFTTVADTTGGYSGFLLPAVNTSGTVAFIASKNNQLQVFSATGGVITPLTAIAGAGIPTSPSINNSGQVAYAQGVSAGPPVVYRLTGNQVTTIHTGVDNSWTTAIANDGTV